MAALDLPPALVQAIEGMRRAFLWNAGERASGAKCLVAWSAVCRPKHEGGLGFKPLAVRNSCLQMKLLHKLHTAAEAPWPRWVWNQTEGQRLATAGHHVAKLASLTPLYRDISTCLVGDGRRTAFWLDRWASDEPLCQMFAALFSHALDPEASVAQVLTRGVNACLVPRLNSAGTRQLPMLLEIISGRLLTQNPDSRRLSRCAKKDGSLDAAALCRLGSWGGVDAPYAGFVWDNFAPSKVKFFAWLLS